jgi:hypothetical protein
MSIRLTYIWEVDDTFQESENRIDCSFIILSYIQTFHLSLVLQKSLIDRIKVA